MVEKQFDFGHGIDNPFCMLICECDTNVDTIRLKKKTELTNKVVLKYINTTLALFIYISFECLE